MPSKENSLADRRKRYDWVVSQLAQYSGVKKPISSTSMFVLCPIHSEKTPSGRLYYSPNSTNPGFFHCYGCGTKLAWDEVAPKLGLKPYTWTKPTEQYAVKAVSAVVETSESAPAQELIYGDLPRDKLWRSISTNLLRDLGGKLCSYRWGEQERMVFLPVYIRKHLRGYIRARLRKSADAPSYLNSKGKWSESHGLFPYDYAVEMMKANGSRTLTLVEGPRDALRLLGFGIPAIAILGTHSWSPQKSRYLELSGAHNIVIMMDGDSAGIAAEDLVMPHLKTMFTTKIHSLHGEDSPYWQFIDEAEPTKAAKAAGVSLWDPGNCPKVKIKELKKMISRLDAS